MASSCVLEKRLCLCDHGIGHKMIAVKIFKVHADSRQIFVLIRCIVINPLFCAAAGGILCDFVLIIHAHAAADMADGRENAEKLRNAGRFIVCAAGVCAQIRGADQA